MNYRPVPKYPWLLTSEDGLVFSTKRYPLSKELSRLAQYDKGGYLSVKSTIDGTLKNLAVHRLIAMAWVDGFEEGLSVNHKDGNKRNNHKDNLEWVSPKQNFRHAQESGLRKNCNGGNGEKRSVWCVPLDKLQYFESISDASRFLGIEPTRGAPMIHAALNGKHKSAYGYAWGYRNPMHEDVKKITSHEIEALAPTEKNTTEASNIWWE